jgi:hypothetical protein
MLTPQEAQQIIHRLAELDKEAEQFVKDPDSFTTDQVLAIWDEHLALQTKKAEALHAIFYHQLEERKAGRLK